MTRLESRQRGQFVAAAESARLKPASEASARSEPVIVAATEASAHSVLVVAHSELAIVAASEASAHYELAIAHAELALRALLGYLIWILHFSPFHLLHF